MSASANFCSYCNHYISWHTEFDRAAMERGDGNKCRGNYAANCDCDKFCIGYEPKAANGLYCDNCGRNYFDHEATKKALQGRLLTSDSLEHMPSDAIGYRVESGGMKLCCRWTLHQFMKRVDATTLKVGVCIQCVHCKTAGIMKVDVMDEGVPGWKWTYKALPSTDTRLVVTGS